MIHTFLNLGRCNTIQRYTRIVRTSDIIKSKPGLSYELYRIGPTSSVLSAVFVRSYTTQGRDSESKHRRVTPANAARVLLWGAVVAFFGFNFASLHIITGRSMSPTINPPTQGFYDIVILNKYAASTRHYFWNVRKPKKQDLKIGDIVVMYSPLDPNLKITKRILALPEDIVIRRGSDHAHVDQQEEAIDELLRIRIPPGHMWVEGDASAQEYQDSSGSSVPSNIKSRDSRQFGPVPMALVIGRVDYIIIPPSRLGIPSSRPDFDAERANEKREARQRNMMTPHDMQLRRAHPDDSAISPYSDWEWISSDQFDAGKAKREKAQRMRRNKEGDGIKRRGRSRRDDDLETIWKDQLNRMSRGGQLGYYVDNENED